MGVVQEDTDIEPSAPPGDDPADPRLACEWLEADGLGGFASGTVGGARSRRYHALLLTATTPPTGRVVLVNGLEAWLERPGAPAVSLSTQFYAPGVWQPDGFRRIRKFHHDPWPCWEFALQDGGSLVQEVFIAADSGLTVLRWRASGAAGWSLHLRPLLSGRDYHALHRENPAFDFTARIAGGNVSWRPYAGLPAIAALSNGIYEHAPLWYRDFLYAEERARGLDDREDLASPGVFRFALDAGEAVLLLRAGDGLAVRPAAHAQALAESERARRAAQRPIERAAALYLVDRPPGRSLLAGFPWFTDWGRDSFIALRGLMLATGRIAEAGDILRAWAGAVDAGMLPNRFPDDGGAPEFNTCDAALWFIVAVHDYLALAEPTPAEIEPLRTAVLAILAGYAGGTRFGIAADADGLLRAGVAGMQLTWMDAKLGDHVITPRIGKPVEIAALWINALRIGGQWEPRWAALAERAQAAFLARFTDPVSGGLYDVIDAGHVAGAVEACIRPNQIFAVGGLPFAVLEGEAAAAVLGVVERHLLTPLGLRSLSPADPAYVGHYRGGPAARDGAYHQGTVWPWLMGGFVQAWLRVHGDGETRRAEARARFLAPLLAHLETAGLGHVSEVADGDAPHTPGGCPFQAWSLGETIRIAHWLSPPQETLSQETGR